MDISSDKLAKSHTKRPGYGYEKETLKEKLNPFSQKPTKQRQKDELYLSETR